MTGAFAPSSHHLLLQPEIDRVCSRSAFAVRPLCRKIPQLYSCLADELETMLKDLQFLAAAGEGDTRAAQWSAGPHQELPVPAEGRAAGVTIFPCPHKTFHFTQCWPLQAAPL